MTVHKESWFKAIAGKYDHIDFTPPESVAEAAAKGLELRKEHGKGGTSVGVARARDLKNRKNLSPSTVKRMVNYFNRHQSDKDAKGSKSDGFWGSSSNPSAGWVAWLLWGGDAGWSWARKVVRQVEKADGKKASIRLAWTDEQETKWQRWLELYKDKYEPEKIKEVRKYWEDNDVGRTDNIQLERSDVEPEPEEVAPQQEVEEELPMSGPLEDDNELYVSYSEWSGMSEEDREQWIKDHDGRSPQYSKPRFQQVDERTSSRIKMEEWTASISAEAYGDEIPGGLADEYEPEDFPEDALEDGVEVELEHTDDEQLALEIAMDHLTEDEDYYEKLEKLGL